ncbi:uncharacterized protein LOC132562110 [Ylistrum balloti]|uniref:uncharacterized protein LOC132562110 n=1 Tax=Ylistrum balloti TaxID=509963 RepID=UPI002905CBBE|nr:uncharacterized protein LOC132562110 [Ylistrum balloti]
MKNIARISVMILTLVCLSQQRHLGGREMTTQNNRSPDNLRRNSKPSISQSLLKRNAPNKSSDPNRSANQNDRQSSSNLRSANQVIPSPRRVRMNTQSLQGQKSIRVRQNSGRPLVQNPQRGSHIISPSVAIKRNQGRQLSRSNSASNRNNFARVVSSRNQNVRITSGRNTHNGIGINRGQTGNGQKIARQERLQLPAQQNSQLGRQIQIQQLPSNLVTTGVERGQGSIIRGHNNIVSTARGSSIIRPNGMIPGQNGEFKQGATNQIRIRTQTDTSKLPFNDFNRNIPIIKENTERGMWKSVPSGTRSVPLDQLKSQSRSFQNQPQSTLILNTQPLVSRGQTNMNLANSKNRMISIQTDPNVMTPNGGNSIPGSTSGIAVPNVVQPTVVQGLGSNGMIALELNLGATTTKTSTNVNSIQSGLSGASSGSTGTATSGLKSSSNSPGNLISTNNVSPQVLQIQKVHSGVTSGGKKKMSLTLSSGQSGTQPIVIEALGNIILSQEKLPDGRVQFVIKADPPTSGTTVKSTTKTTTPVRRTVTTTATTVTELPTTTTAIPTSTPTLPTSTIFMEETEMPEPGEFTYPPSGLGTTEPM